MHAAVEGYAPTPVVSLPALARSLGIARLHVKDESWRFGLRAFKGLGASWALHRLLAEGQAPTVVASATDGNHGRALAWAARRAGLRSAVYLPSAASREREAAIAAYGAEIHRIAGTYDEAVAACAADCERHGWALVQDSAWEGYEKVPRWIMQGYLTMVHEALEQLDEPPTHVLLQCGVGSFAAAVTAYLVNRLGAARPRILVVEPEGAACGLAAAQLGEDAPPEIPGDLHTFMACLSCARLSTIAWSILRQWADEFVACEDEVASRGMRMLALPGDGDIAVESGESGAVTVGLLPDLDLPGDARVLCFSTEGATDPAVFRQVTGREPWTPCNDESRSQ